MALSPGTRLGPYEILSALGAGGMGEVYKARDGRLDRTVAIKILPQALAGDEQFRERFDREARAISHLDHPHICALYDIGEDQGTAFLIMQYLEGETLENCLKKGPLPLDQALKTAVEIASALETAHRAGIVHRDLKPGNIILTKAGAKLLDFGLAKTTAVANAGLSMLQTTPAAMTAHGTILGTFQYMAPEQIEGEDVDARSDIFAFGAVLYEMLTGQKAFSGRSQASLLGAILKDEAPRVSVAQPMTPPALDYLVRTCLAKDPDARFQTAHDVALQLRWIGEGGSAAGIPAPVASKRRTRERLAWAVAAGLGVVALGAGALAVIHLRERPAPADPVQFSIAAEQNSAFVLPAEFAISPDGRQILFQAASSGSSAGQSGAMLWVRPLATLTARALPGTEGAAWASAFWSPDGRYIGFAATGKLKKVDVSGGPPITLAGFSGTFAGGTWNKQNVIVFGTSESPLQKVDAAGGTPTPVTAQDKDENPRWPWFLPDDQHVLYVSVRGSGRELRIASLTSTETSAVGATESNGFYSSGHLLFVRGGTLMARPFDAEALRPIGEPFPVAEQISTSAGAARASISGSATGVLAYWRGGGLSISRLTWTERTGKTVSVVGDPAAYTNLSLSPDERRVAVALTAGSPVNRDIWVLDLARADTATRLTFDPGQEGDPIWSPDGSQVVFNSNRSGSWNSGFQRAADGGSDDVPLVKMGRLFDSPDWSHDGRFIVFTGARQEDSNDLWVLPLSGDRKPAPFLQTPFREDSPAFSPDDRWVAYNSDASGRFEVYVRSFPGPGGQYQISRNGGWAPKWRSDGKEIFFLALDGTMMAADVTLGKEVQAAVPQALFPSTLLKGTDRHPYAVTKDGKRFLLRVPDQRQVSVPITVVLNWPALAKK
jgi:Tol biopolymer transport system component/predicted Ser/Thr protein kinase